jgi:poly(A) polymerase
MSEIGLLKYLISELEDLRGVPQPLEYHQEGDVWDHTMRALKYCDDHASRDVKWAVLFHDIGKPETFKLKERIRYDGHCEKSAEIAKNILTRFKYPKKEIKDVIWMIEHHMMMQPLLDLPEGKVRKWFLKENFLNLMQVFEADAKGIIPTDLSMYEEILARYREVLKEMPEGKPKPFITGKDVMKITGLEPGEKVGEVIEDIYEKQLAKEITSRAEAIEFLKNL